MTDRIIDNVPQASKQFSVLAAYGSDMVLNDIPSSMMKNHENAVSVLTEKAADILMEYRKIAEKRSAAKLTPEMHERLKALWEDSANPEAARKSIAAMDSVLEKLGFI